MRPRLILISGVVSLLIAGAASAAVMVKAEDGAAYRIDAAKLTKLTEAAIHRTAPRAAVDVSIVVGRPDVWLSAHGIVPGRPLPADAVPPPDGPFIAGRGARGARNTYETVRARYTIADAQGKVLESVPLVLEVGHGTTLEAQLSAMRLTADYVAARVAALTR